MIARDGIDATVEAIAQAAGVGMGTLYRRFPTKESLLRAVLGEMLARVIDDLDETTREHKRLSELKRLVALEAETLRERQRVHAIAERALGMVAPDPSQVVVVLESSNRVRGRRAR